MATRFYIHRTAKSLGSGTLPSTEQSTLTQVLLHDALANNKDMNTTISSSAQTTFANSFALTSSTKVCYVSRWVSDFLGVTSISANTWTLNFAANSNGSICYYPTDGSGKVYMNLYVWRPSTGAKVGTMVADLANTGTSGNELNTSERTTHVNFTGSAVTCQADDVIICEVWLKPKDLSGGTFTCTFYYDGTTVNATDDVAASNHAAFLQTPQDNLFSVPAVDCTVTGKDIATKQIVHG